MCLRFRTRFRSDEDDWTTEGSSINADAKLHAIRREIEERGPVILEHRHCRGSREPTRLVFDDHDALCRYLEMEAFAGDSLSLWSFEDVCSLDRLPAAGKCPAEDGTVSRGGAYWPIRNADELALQRIGRNGIASHDRRRS